MLGEGYEVLTLPLGALPAGTGPGGDNVAHIPCLNDSERGMAVIRDVVTRELQGWL